MLKSVSFFLFFDKKTDFFAPAISFCLFFTENPTFYFWNGSNFAPEATIQGWRMNRHGNRI